MFGLFAQQKPVQSVSAVKRAALIDRLCDSLGSQYEDLKQYRAL